ncbi:pilus assembly protein TadG-related protein [Agrococcus sediminis]|uniref:pilus assembly protein TadG-related protein n=1 Tax=Agrococcus TaxID=46352 RepID=UPI001FF27D73|nr:pilus assembly protein TadG-related protein [Agrococcus sp. SCSIO52902]UOW00823.1 pilus assembly protein TadG-related protein [Agrococcus sp. SCSIO52902]UOW00885.1 pilus assembly protein TadG-related protein [Agrococcus sp. SCSIO52902]
MRRVLRRLAREDDGSTLVLTMGFAALALALILAVTAATSMLIERRRLFTVADGAALAAAEAFALEQVRFDGTAAAPELADAAVDEAAAAWASRAAAGLDDVRVDGASADARSASVTVSSAWRPPVVSLFLPESIRLDVTSTARAVFVD